MAEHLNHYTTSTKADACPSAGSGTIGGRSSGRGTRGGATQKKGQLNAMEKKLAGTGGQSRGCKKGQGRGRGKSKGNVQSIVKCWSCGGPHPLWQCKEWQELRK